MSEEITPEVWAFIWRDRALRWRFMAHGLFALVDFLLLLLVTLAIILKG